MSSTLNLLDGVYIPDGLGGWRFERDLSPSELMTFELIEYETEHPRRKGSTHG